MYKPNNTAVYLKAFAGFMGGITAVAVTGTEPRDFESYGQMADAFAQEVDTVWGKQKPTGLELDEILVASESVWASRSPLPTPDDTDPAAYLTIAESVVARVRQGNAQVVSEGINPNGGITPPAPGTSLPNVLTFQPGGEAHPPNQFTDWDALYAEFLITKGPVLIAFDGTFSPVVGGSALITLPLDSFDMQGRATWATSNSQFIQVAIPDGGVIRNLAGFMDNFQLNVASTATSPLQYDGPFPSLEVTNEAAFLQRGAAPVIEVGANQNFFLTLAGNVNCNSFNSFAELVGMTDATSQLALVVFDNFNFFNASGKLVSGPVGSQFAYQTDSTAGSWLPVANPNFHGTVTEALLTDSAPFVVYSPNDPTKWPVTIPTQVAQALDLLAARPSSASASFIYRPNAPASGTTFSDPWQCWLAAFLAGVPVTIYVDCSAQSPAPWPVDSFMVNMTMAQSPIVAAPAVLGLVAGTNPFSPGPSNGALTFVDGLDGVGVVNVSSVPAQSMVLCGDIFGQTFFMQNGAYIQRANDAAAPALGINSSGEFELRIDNCQNPFPNLADPIAANVQFTDSGGTLTTLVSRAGPDLHLPSFQGPAGATLNLRYDDSVSSSQLGQADWAGTVNLIPLAVVGTSGYVIFRPGTPSAGNAVSTPAEVAVAAANGAASLYVDSSLAPAVLPAGYTLPLFPGGVIGYRGLNGGFPNADLLTVADTASLGVNIYFQTIKVSCACLTTGVFNFNPATTPLAVRLLNSFFVLAAGATVPAYKVPSGQTFEAISSTLCAVAGVAGVPFFGASSGGTLAGFAAFSSRWQPTAMEGDAGSTVIFNYDASSTPLGAFAGVVQYQRPSDIGSLSYDVGATNPVTRPGGTPLSVGQPFYRTDLTIPVWFDGTQWRDATGTVVP